MCFRYSFPLGNLDDKVVLYAAGDVVHLEDIRDQQIKDCDTKTCAKAAQIENAFVPVIAYLEWCGIRLDINRWEKKMKDNELKRDESLEKLNEWVVNYFKTHGGSSDGCVEEEVTIEERFGDQVVKHPLPKGYTGKESVYVEHCTDDLLNSEYTRKYIKIRKKHHFIVMFLLAFFHKIEALL